MNEHQISTPTFHYLYCMTYVFICDEYRGSCNAMKDLRKEGLPEEAADLPLSNRRRLAQWSLRITWSISYFLANFIAIIPSINNL